MSKELYVTSTPHETKLAVVEDDQLVEVFFERENEYTLAGSIYKGKVTRVLPGMQSAFVEIGLERDAFLYVTDFLEEVEEDDSEPIKQAAEGERSDRPERTERTERADRPERNDRGERSGRDRGGRHRRNRHSSSSQQQQARNAAPPVEGGFTIEHDSTQGFDVDTNGQIDAELEPLEAVAPETSETQPGTDAEARGPRRWRGRRGRRRGRGVPEAKLPNLNLPSPKLRSLKRHPQERPKFCLLFPEISPVTPTKTMIHKQPCWAPTLMQSSMPMNRLSPSHRMNSR
jgi:ribonuclease E